MEFIFLGMPDADTFHETLKAMNVLNMKEDDIKSTLRIVSAVLHFGNMEFKKERGNDQFLTCRCHLYRMAFISLVK